MNKYFKTIKRLVYQAGLDLSDDEIEKLTTHILAFSRSSHICVEDAANLSIMMERLNENRN